MPVNKVISARSRLRNWFLWPPLGPNDLDEYPIFKPDYEQLLAHINELIRDEG